MYVCKHPMSTSHPSFSFFLFTDTLSTMSVSTSGGASLCLVSTRQYWNVSRKLLQNFWATLNKK